MTRPDRPVGSAFEGFPDGSRLWVFAASRPLGEPEERGLLDRVDRFLSGWRAHGRPLSAAMEWRDGHFLLVAVDERVEAPSGCSIDALVRGIASWSEETGIELMDRSRIWCRTPSGIRALTRAAFRSEAEAGTIDRDTPVFDLSASRVGDLRQRAGWERPAGEGWTARYFEPGAP